MFLPKKYLRTIQNVVVIGIPKNNCAEDFENLTQKLQPKTYPKKSSVTDGSKGNLPKKSSEQMLFSNKKNKVMSKSKI